MFDDDVQIRISYNVSGCRPGDEVGVVVELDDKGGARARLWSEGDPDDGRGPWQQLDPASAGVFRDLLSKVRLTGISPYVWGADGVIRELTIKSGYNFICLRWWVFLPEEWSSVQPLVEQLEALMDHTK